mmetsp:Transcript_10038/g.13984  ORF Transcript_10038/g.13984 Transcript_10038/m.13984 type:complete len:224 (+) Transcript_10038:1639-2310(+)|eukprot:CAMPEP_0184487590 /NCGR_PEP_ID=MMETSP0113_2-20130426/10211_1 /TAXON_ID=91329 /ORGANISM="Norrisiella sphaerica, Strain BC52" /LENGTH=223 /DNA_ID=CAMNT_0026869949 /DNA_START=150 /DNA_END=821 /DNA_ORIENTATION=-
MEAMTLMMPNKTLRSLLTPNSPQRIAKSVKIDSRSNLGNISFFQESADLPSFMFVREEEPGTPIDCRDNNPTQLQCMMKQSKAFSDCRLTATNLLSTMKSFQIDVSEKEIEEVIQKHDKLGKGYISYSDLGSLLQEEEKEWLERKVEKKEFVSQEVFDLFDKDSDGFINCSDLAKTMKDMGEEMPMTEIKRMVKENSSSGQNRLNRAEFTNLMKNVGMMDTES